MGAQNTASYRRRNLDAYLRSELTPVARRIHSISEDVGPAYTSSRTKRGLDLALAVPGTLIAVPTILALALANKWREPHLPALFAQKRVGHQGPVWVVKVRTLSPTRRQNGDAQTVFSRRMRAYYLDELPQIPQVLTGQLSMVGIRVLPVPVYDLLHRSWSPPRFDTWQRAYHVTPLGLTGIHQVYRRRGKDDLYRFHRDLFYVRRASLGLDLYLIWRTVRSIGRLPG